MLRKAIALAVLAASPAATQQVGPVEAIVSRDGDTFVTEFTFPSNAAAWAFWRSTPAESDRKSWRARSWTVLTPGVELQRRGRYDAFVASNGGVVPRKVRVRVKPFTEEVAADYVPALLLGGRSVALFDGHFSVFSVSKAAALDAMGSEPDEKVIGDSGTRVRFIPGRRPFRLAGDIEGYRRGMSSGAYGLFDVPRATVTNGVATVIDSEMPSWFTKDVGAFTPQVIRLLQSRLGPSGLVEPTILAAWEGATRDGVSMNGGTLKGLILMRVDGRGALTEGKWLRDRAHWFIAHEASHFWLGQAIGYQSQRDNWIMEGGADLLAARTVQKLVPGYSPREFLNEAITDCAKAATKPVAEAPERGEYRTTYACGTVLALVAEKASNGDFYAFTHGLIDRHKTKREVNTVDWLAELDRASGNPALSGNIRALLDKGSPNPKNALADLLRNSGIAFTTTSDGIPTL